MTEKNPVTVPKSSNFTLNTSELMEYHFKKNSDDKNILLIWNFLVKYTVSLHWFLQNIAIIDIYIYCMWNKIIFIIDKHEIMFYVIGSRNNFSNFVNIVIWITDVIYLFVYYVIFLKKILQFITLLNKINNQIRSKKKVKIR